MVWNSAALRPAARISPILRTNTPLWMKSDAWAVNIMSPLGTISTKLAAVQGSTCPASFFTDSSFETPSSRRSSTAIEPKSSAMPVMWTISTLG